VLPAEGTVDDRASQERGCEHPGLMVPSALREGRNRVELFQVGRGRVLRPLGRA
jgi:hypothetical protein